METQFIPYEQALALKELGFNEPCFFTYNIWNTEKLNNSYSNYVKHNNNNSELVSAPLYQQAFRWFREEHQLFLEILIDKTTSPKFSYKITEFEGNPKKLSEKEWDWKFLISAGLFRSYEEAEIEGLEKLIEILKNK